MQFKTHHFTDDLGGRLKYMDQPDRLSELLQKDSKRKHVKARHTPELDIKAHAQWYVNHIIYTASKQLIFYPHKKGTLQSFANQFQHAVLMRLTNTFDSNYTSYTLKYLRGKAVELGYTLNEYTED